MRACSNSGLIRSYTSRSEDAHSSSVASTDPPSIAAAHDRRTRVISKPEAAQNRNCNARLRTHCLSQKMTVAARVMALMKVWAQRS